MAQYLLVILAYRFNVSAGINHSDKPDFGHSDLHVEDWIQSRIMDIWGKLLFPDRINVSEFSPLNFTSVGIGPLTFDEKYVQKGDPAECIKGDARFMAL